MNPEAPFYSHNARANPDRALCRAIFEGRLIEEYIARLAGTARFIPLGVLTQTREHNFGFRTGSPMRPCGIASS